MGSNTDAKIGPLGIIQLERADDPEDVPPSPEGTLTHPSTFAFPTLVEVAPGAWVENVVRGYPEVEAAFLTAAKRLVARGAAAVTSTCGFSYRHQKVLAAEIPVPVATSSLLLLPQLLRTVEPEGAIAVMTYDAKYCDDRLLDLDDPKARSRVVVGGLEGTVYWHNELEKPAIETDPSEIESAVWDRIEKMRAERPDIRTILLECTGFPPTAPMIRRRSGLPVYDIVGLCESMMRALGV